MLHFNALLFNVQESTQQFEEAQRLTGEASEQARIAQSRAAEATKATHSADVARREADDIRRKQDAVAVRAFSYVLPFCMELFQDKSARTSKGRRSGRRPAMRQATCASSTSVAGGFVIAIFLDMLNCISGREIA